MDANVFGDGSNGTLAVFNRRSRLCFAPYIGLAADPGLVTKQSNHSVADTVQRFEAAVNASAANSWMLFTEIDYAAAAQKAGLQMRPRMVIVFGNPKLDTPNMQKVATLAIDVPPKALV